MFRLQDNDILEDVDYSPLEILVKEKFPEAVFSGEEVLSSIFIEDSAFMCILDKSQDYRIWLFLFQVMEDEWICSISKETDIDTELYRTRVYVEPMGDFDKVFVPYRLIKQGVENVAL
jgi:hypothetical protein